LSQNGQPGADKTSDSALLTLAMIVRDGGQNLTPLLAAAIPWVDEIIIGDTGSSDGSVAVGRQHGAQVLRIAWCDNFARARNQVLDYCHGAWVLILDADEQLAEIDWRALRQWTTQRRAEGRPLAASISTRNYLTHRYSRRGWLPIPPNDPHALAGGAPTDGFVITTKVRLFPNRPEVRFRGPIHETVEASLWDAGIPIVSLPSPIHHFGYLEPRRDKDERYLHLAHLKTTEQPHDAKAWAELAECAITVGDHRQALVAIERSLLLEPNNPDRRLTAGWLLKEADACTAADRHLAFLTTQDDVDIHLVAEAAHLRAQIAIQENRPRQATEFLADALRHFPDNGHFQNTLGTLNLILGRGEAARRALQLSCELLPNQAEPCLNLALLYENVGETKLAQQYYAEAQRRDPDNSRAAVGLKKTTPAPISG